MVTIYLDVLIGLNLYISWMLLLCVERLCASRLHIGRRAIGALLGGASSLLILLPPLPFWMLLIIRLGIAALVVFCCFGYTARGVFLKRVAFFFGVNFLFAGCMMAIWTIFTPPKLLTRNGSLYYHLSPLTLILSTILAYLAVKILAFFLDRRKLPHSYAEVKAALDGREVLLRLWLDTGNTARSLGGLPVVFCTASCLLPLLPPEAACCFDQLDMVAALSGHHLAGRIQTVSYQVLGSRQIAAGFVPDYLEREGSGKVKCLLLPVREQFRDGEADGIAGEALFTELFSSSI